VDERRKMAGGSRSVGNIRGTPAEVLTAKDAKAVPKFFDWRNVSGKNYVPDVRDQKSCGSCYIFAVTAMLTSRIRIATNNGQKTELSPQSVISCSNYSQGCEGGFPYLVGKYGMDYGILTADCFNYSASDTPKCSQACKDADKKRVWVSKYYYVGGYYGASSAATMQQEILANGPIAIGFEVYNDFFKYKGGVYVHNKSKLLAAELAEPGFEETNHAVLFVGWGEELVNGVTVPYWIAQNSWSAGWGEQGYFRILRGVDECACESLSVSAFPMV